MTFLKPAMALFATLSLLSPAALPLLIPQAGSGGTQSVPAQVRWSWPLSPKPGVMRAFDPPDKPWLSGHRGVDLGPAPDDGQVTAPADGVVTFAGVVVDRPVLTIEHSDGLKSSFEPVSSSLKPGDAVIKGRSIGTLEPAHCGNSICLHWGVRRGEDYINPLDLVQDMRPSILLPLE